MSQLQKLLPVSRAEGIELEPFLNFFGVFHLITAKIEIHLHTFGLTVDRFTILLYFYRNSEGMTPSQLADSLGVSRSMMSTLIESLIHNNLVGRQVNRRDRRIATIH